MLDYLSFMVSGALAALVQDRPDVVLATSPQFFAAVAGWGVAALRGVPFVFELRDLWPESIKAVGAMRQSLAIRALERLELFLYRRASAVVAATASFRDNLARRGIDPGKVAVVRNGVDLSRYAPRPRDRALAEHYGVAGKFVVGYLGTHGMAHALQRVLEAAELLRERDDVHFRPSAPEQRAMRCSPKRSPSSSPVPFHRGCAEATRCPECGACATRGSCTSSATSCSRP